MDTGLGAKAYAIIEQGKIGLILSSRPTDRRQLIEEAAGVTKYRARRRTAELKLDAAQQNLTRIDDIIFEVEKQRGTLKRQAAKARRYQRLRDELRRWEKVLLARRQRVLAQAIAAAEARIVQVQAEEAAAAARLAEREADSERVRIEIARCESDSRERREAAHAHEVEIGRLDQRIQGDEAQRAALARRAADISGETEALAARRGPAAEDLAARQRDAAQAAQERDGAAAALAAANEAQAALQATLDGFEADVEAVRAEQYAAASAATALQHAIENAASARDRVSRDLARWSAEAADLHVEAARAQDERQAASAALDRARAQLDAVMRDRGAREAEVASLRGERDRLALTLREHEQDLAEAAARLTSLEEFEAARTAYGDAARLVLSESAGAVQQAGSVADYLEVAPGYERAVEACLGDALQYVIVPSHDEAARGLAFVRERHAGRCGFVVAGGDGAGGDASAQAPVPGLVPLASVVSVTGPHAGAIRPLLARAWLASSYAEAVSAAAATGAPIATPDGDVCHGPRVVLGGSDRDESRGILGTKRDLKDLRERLAAERSRVSRVVETAADIEHRLALGIAGIDSLTAEIHRQEMAAVGFELRIVQADDDIARIAQKQELVALDARRAEEEIAGLDVRQADARASVLRLAEDQRSVDERLAAAQRRLFEAREDARVRGDRVRDAMTEHARLLERAAALALDAARAEEAQREIETRLAAREDEQGQIAAERERLERAVAEARRALDAEVEALDRAREQVRLVDDTINGLRAQSDETEASIREARRARDAVREARAETELARARAASDLSHLEDTCLEMLSCGLDAVIAEVEQLERDGDVSPDWRTIYAEEPDEEAADAEARAEAPAAEPAAADAAAPGRAVTPDEAIDELKRKIERLGPVNMMAIEEFDELDVRHAFLTGQRKDLIASIADTGEAIKRIDQTTRQRFREAFDAINLNFQQMFGTLFGGGRAGLTLIDEEDILESGIEIIAQPPGKRLQNVQLLSGGEKALTAISLMFGIFKYKPSPFCLLDEIDAPLDDANTGRFLDMLRELQAQTQFILITHNRKTMEIADRLYGVTMEEPGVSKLISVRLN
jgi:chromosome segregation protein